jgi:hypothetical protein
MTRLCEGYAAALPERDMQTASRLQENQITMEKEIAQEF